MRRLTRDLTAAAALSAALVALGTAPVSALDRWASFSAVADADGLHIAARVPGGPVNDNVMDGGAPRAQALLDSLGSSTAFSAAPWPGALVANATGLASGPTGLPLPTYPLIASSSHPTMAADDKMFGPVVLAARSGLSTSSSRGQLASAGTGTVDTVATVAHRPDGVLTAQADTVVSGLTVGPLVLGRVESHSAVARRPDGSLTRTASTSVSGARVGTQAVELTPDGISVLGTGVPLGPGHPALKPLTDQGIVISWVRAVESKDGVVSPAIEITVTRPVSLTGQGSSTVRYTVGRTAARVGVSGAMPKATTSTRPPATSGGFELADTSRDTTAAGPVTPVVDAPAPAVQALPVAQSRPALGAVRRVAEVWPTSFYLPLVAAAVLMLGGAAALRTWGVRGVWES